MTARYPAQFPLFQPQIDGVDGVNAVDVNILYEEVDAIAAALGIDPKGAAATVGARIGAVETAGTTYVSNNGGSTILSTAATTRGLVVKGHASQSVNLFEVKDNSNNIFFSVGSSGTVTFTTAIDGGNAS
jgi:hypothetical protein